MTTNEEFWIGTEKIYPSKPDRYWVKMINIVVLTALILILFTLVATELLSLLPNPVPDENPLSLSVLLSFSLALAGLYLFLQDDEKIDVLAPDDRKSLRIFTNILFLLLFTFSCALEVSQAIDNTADYGNELKRFPEADLFTYYLHYESFWESILQPDRLIFLTVVYCTFLLYVMLYTFEIPRGLLRKDLIEENRKTISSVANKISEIELQQLLQPEELLMVWKGKKDTLQSGEKFLRQVGETVARCVISGLLCSLIAILIYLFPFFDLHSIRPPFLMIWLKFSLLAFALCLIQLAYINKFAETSDRLTLSYVGIALLASIVLADFTTTAESGASALPTVLISLFLLISFGIQTTVIARSLRKVKIEPQYSSKSVEDFFRIEFNGTFEKRVSSITQSAYYSKFLKKCERTPESENKGIHYNPQNPDFTNDGFIRFLGRINCHVKLYISRTIFNTYLRLFKEIEEGLRLRSDPVKYHNAKNGSLIKFVD